MTMPNRRHIFSSLVALTIALAPAGAQAAGKLNVFAAASLKTALDGVAAAWTAETGKEAALTYAASSALAKQIEGGAPADVFISADLDWMKYLTDKSIVTPGSEVKLLGNQIVLVAPADSKAETKIAANFPLAVLVGDGRLAMADVKSVPAGKYAKAALEKLGVWASVESKVAQAENVRAALKLVATGEAPLGIVYATDAKAEPGVKVIGVFPAESHAPIVYPAAPVAASQDPDAAAFMGFLQSAKAKVLFEQQGFTYLAAIATN